jgi:hypothetical protein
MIHHNTTTTNNKNKKVLITHKYRGSQQSSREVKPKFIDLTPAKEYL